MPGFGVSAYARQQALERIERLARAGLDVAAFLSEADAVLDCAVPSGIETTPAPTWLTLDPASLLFTSMVSEGCSTPWSVQEMAWFEYASGMAGNRVGEVVRSPRGVQTLRQLIETDPGGAGDYVELLRSMGAGQEVLVALRARDGQHWGAVYLAREPGRPDFSSEELDCLRLVAAHLAEGIRSGLLWGEASDPEEPDAPAVVVFGPNLDPESFTPGAQQWLADLPARPASWRDARRRALRGPGGPQPVGWARRGRQCAGALAASRVGDGARTGADGPRRAARGGDYPAGRGRPDHSTADGRLRVDPAGGRGHSAHTAGRLHRPDRRGAVHLPLHRIGAPQTHLRQDLGPQPSRTHEPGLHPPLPATRSGQPRTDQDRSADPRWPLRRPLRRDRCHTAPTHLTLEDHPAACSLARAVDAAISRWTTPVSTHCGPRSPQDRSERRPRLCAACSVVECSKP